MLGGKKGRTEQPSILNTNVFLRSTPNCPLVIIQLAQLGWEVKEL